MKRVEEFKKLRKHRRKCISIVILFMVITVIGISVSDYCINSIVKNEKRVEILKLEKKKDSTLNLNILNNVINIKFSGVANDFENIKKKLVEWSQNLFK